MSYILDALKRADAERERGHVPGLHAHPQQEAGSAERTGPVARWAWWAGAAAGAAVLAALAWRMGADSNAPPLVPLQTPPAETARAPAELAAPNASRAPAAALAAPPTLAPPTAPTVVTTAPAVPSYAPPPAAARAAKEGRSAGAAASAPASAAVAQATPSQATPPAAAAAPARIPLLSELPATLRKQLPPLAVGGSVYSDDAAARFIMLNGDVVKEGGQPAPGLVVERIEARSAVLRFQGERFRLPY